jgi:hypothetical protein
MTLPLQAYSGESAKFLLTVLMPLACSVDDGTMIRLGFTDCGIADTSFGTAPRMALAID